MSAVPLFALRERMDTPRFPGFIVRDPDSGRLVNHRELGRGYLLQPATFSLEEALEHARAQATRLIAWTPVPNHGPCPHCGRAIGSNDLDFLYNAPSGWKATCLKSAGGCGHSVTGATSEEALSRWDSPHHLPAEAC